MAKTLKPIKPDQYNWARYNRALHGLVLYPLIREINKRIVNAEREYKAIRKAIANIPQDPSLAGLTGAAAKTQAAYLLKKHDAEFTRAMRSHLGIRYRITDNSKVDRLMQEFIKKNVSLVKTIPPRLHAGLERDIIKLQQKGPFDQKALSDMLSKNYNSAGYNLRRLTRDQTSKAIGNLTNIRQTDAGLTDYIWRTSGDERVRSSHKVLNGRRFKWSSSPPEGHPGHPIQCRCYAEGVMPPIRQVKQRQARIIAQRPQPTGRTFLSPPKKPTPPPKPAKPKFDFVKDTEKALQNVPEGYGGMDVLSVAKARWGNQAHQVAKSGKEFDGLKGQILTRAIANDEFLDGNIEGKSGGYGVVGNGLYFAKYKKGGITRSSSYFEGGGHGEKGHMYSVKLADDAKVVNFTEEIEEQVMQFKKDVMSGKIKAPMEVLMFVSNNMYDAWAFYNGVDAWTGLLGDMVVLNRRKVIVDPRSLKDGEFYKEANSPGFKKYRYDEIVDKMVEAYDK